MENLPLVRGVEDFDSFYRREYRAVLGLALVLSRNRPIAEELTQEAFLATFRRWDRVGRMENPGAWVRRVVANRSVSTFRRATAETKALLRLATGAQRRAVLDPAESVDIWREVRRLPHRQAQVVALTYLDGATRREVAEILGCSEETVKTHLQRARQTLSNRLNVEGEHGR